MGKLVLTLPDGRTRDIALDRERITIGRRADNDVCLSFPSVSAEHAVVVTNLADSFLEDLDSTNGTLVNGRPIARHLLHDHDEIEIGRQLIVYVAGEFATATGGAAGAMAAADDRTMTGYPAPVAPACSTRGPGFPGPAAAPHGSRGAAAFQRKDGRAEAVASRSAAAAMSGSGRRVDTMPHAPDAEIVTVAQGADPPPGAAAPHGSRPALEVLEGAGAGRVVPVDRDVFVIGRAGCQVAAAMRTPEGLRLVHVEGAAPPRINGAALPDEGSLLALGDEIEIAGARLRFHPGA